MTAQYSPHKKNALGAPGEVQVWDVARLKPNPLNPRGALSKDEPGIRELAASIREQGLIEPLVITTQGLIVAGHRRHLACTLAGVSRVRVVVRNLSEQQQLEIMLVENLQRQDLNPLEEARGYLNYLEKTGNTVADTARNLGVNSIRVSQRLAILELPVEVQHWCASGDVPLSAVPELVRLEDEADQRRVAGLLASGALSVPKLKKYVADPAVRTRPQGQVRVRGLANRRNYERVPADTPKGPVRDRLVEALRARSGEQVSLADLVKHFNFVSCACGMAATEKSQETMCAACPLAMFVNRLVGVYDFNNLDGSNLTLKEREG